MKECTIRGSYLVDGERIPNGHMVEENLSSNEKHGFTGCLAVFGLAHQTT